MRWVVVLQPDTWPLLLLCSYLAQLCVQWINSLKVAPPITDPAKDLTSGLLLCNLVQRVIPNCALSGVNRKPRARAPAIANIEKALAVLWKHRVSSGRIPTAQEVRVTPLCGCSIGAPCSW